MYCEGVSEVILFVNLENFLFILLMFLFKLLGSYILLFRIVFMVFVIFCVLVVFGMNFSVFMLIIFEISVVFFVLEIMVIGSLGKSFWICSKLNKLLLFGMCKLSSNKLIFLLLRILIVVLRFFVFLRVKVGSDNDNVFFSVLWYSGWLLVIRRVIIVYIFSFYLFRCFFISVLIIDGFVNVDVLFNCLCLLVVILCKIWCIILLEWVLGNLWDYWIILGVVIGFSFWCIYVLSFLVRVLFVLIFLFGVM